MFDNETNLTDTTEEQVEEVTGKVAPENETAAEGSTEKEQTTKDMTKAVSERIKKAADKAREAAKAESAASLNSAMNILKKLGYDVNSPEELSSLEAAEKLNVDPKAYAQLLAEAKQNDPMIQAAREVVLENIRNEDLAAIKEAYPDCKAETVKDLGEIYMKLMASGEMDALTAYEAQLAHESRTTKKPPASMGSVKTAGSDAQKEYYSPSDVDKLTNEDFDRDPTLYARVRKSMLKWSKK